MLGVIEAVWPSHHGLQTKLLMWSHTNISSKKLKYSAIKGPCLHWIEDLLKNRSSQRVLIDGQCSEEAALPSGVPQGSVLWPIIFLAFNNDMPEHLNSKFLLFTDDTIIYRGEINADFDQAQQDLDSLYEWETLWGMSFNPSKCHIMHVNKNRKAIPRDYTIKGQTLNTINAAMHLPTGIVIVRLHLEQTSRKGGSKSQQNSRLHQKNCHNILLWDQSGADLTPPPPLPPPKKIVHCCGLRDD